MLLYFLGALVLILVVAWKFYPVGEVSGRKIVFGDLVNSNIRYQLKIARAEAAIQGCRALPPSDRLPALLKVEDRYGEVFSVGDEIRKAIIATGTSAAARHFQRIVKAPYGATSIRAGLSEALNSGLAEEDFKVKAFQFLVDGLDQKSLMSVCQDKIPALLLRLDEEWALRILCSPEYMNPNHELFGAILDALLDHGATLPREQIDSWIAHYCKRPLQNGEGHKYIQVLKALHHHDSDLAESLLNQEVAQMTTVGAEAAETLLIARDLPHPTFGLSDLEESIGFGALTAPEKTVWLVNLYNYLTSGEGLSNLDWREEADQMIDMHVALTEVGANNHAARLKAYVALFGTDGPPATVTERMATIGMAGESWKAAVDIITQQFDHLEHVSLLALRFELDHADHFRKRSEIREILAK